MAWQYNQRTGELSQNGRCVAGGYSGAGVGRNNPAMETLPYVGPIPRGSYRIGLPHQGHRTGPHVMDLTPVGHTAHRRTDLQIHADNPKNAASTGCIVLPPDVRRQISNSGDNVLEVVQ